MKRRFVVHTEYSGPLLGDRFRMSRKTADGAEASTPLDDQEDTVEEFVAYFYEFVRDDAAAVAALDRVLKARYGDVGGE